MIMHYDSEENIENYNEETLLRLMKTPSTFDVDLKPNDITEFKFSLFENLCFAYSFNIIVFDFHVYWSILLFMDSWFGKLAYNSNISEPPNSALFKYNNSLSHTV